MCTYLSRSNLSVLTHKRYTIIYASLFLYITHLIRTLLVLERITSANNLFFKISFEFFWDYNSSIKLWIKWNTLSENLLDHRKCKIKYRSKESVKSAKIDFIRSLTPNNFKMVGSSCCGCITLKRGSIVIGSFTFLLSASLFIIGLITWINAMGKETVLGDDQLTQFALCITFAVTVASVFLICGIYFEKINFIKAWLIADGGLIFYFVERSFHLSEIKSLSFLAFIGAFLGLSFFFYIWTVVDAYYLELIKRNFNNKDADSEVTTPVVDTPPCKDNLYTELTTKWGQEMKRKHKWNYTKIYTPLYTILDFKFFKLKRQYIL